MKQPAVSVLMTAFNRQSIVGDAIESVLASEFSDFELIIVDDGSADDTFLIANRYSSLDARVRVFRNPQNLGDYPNRNQAAKYAKGHYLKYLDSDDKIYPWGLGAMVRCMNEFPQAGIGLSVADLNDRCHPVCLSPREAYIGHYLGSRDYFSRAPGSAIIVREAFERCGGFTGRRQVGDHEFWLIACRTFPMVTLPRDLIWDRVHGAQEQNAHSEHEKSALHFRVAVEALQHPDSPLDRHECTQALRRLKRQNLKQFWRKLILQRAPIEAFKYLRAMQSVLPIQ